AAHVPADARLHGRGGRRADARHRREHGHLLRREHGAAVPENRGRRSDRARGRRARARGSRRRRRRHVLLPAPRGRVRSRLHHVGRPLEGPAHGGGGWIPVSPGYFDVFSIPLLRGRDFTNRDAAGAGGVVIINQAMARRFWPQGDPLSDQLTIGRGAGRAFREPPRQIIGVVSDVRNGALDQEPQPTMYIPQAQMADGVTALNARLVPLVWVVRTRADPHALSAPIQRALRGATGGLPVARIRSMDEVVVQSTARADFNMLLLTVFGFAALLLAAIGVYGLVSY